jgi:DHA1 family purine ribonucleoside efflux pump-like MFS transporter
MTLAGFDVDGLTLVLLSFGIASFIGLALLGASQAFGKSGLAISPLVLTACAVALVLWGESKIVASTVAIIWGFAFADPVGWSTWITRSLSDQAEKAGSIQVAVISWPTPAAPRSAAWRSIYRGCRRWCCQEY